MEKIFTARFYATMLALALVSAGIYGCSRDQVVEEVLLPYLTHCDADLHLLKQLLERNPGEFEMTVLHPSKNFLPGFRINSLIRIAYDSGDLDAKKTVERSASTYMSRCGPNSVVTTQVEFLSEDLIRDIIASSPGNKSSRNKPFSLALEGADLSIYY